MNEGEGRPPRSQAQDVNFGECNNCTTSFPGSLVCKLQAMESCVGSGNEARNCSCVTTGRS